MMRPTLLFAFGGRERVAVRGKSTRQQKVNLVARSMPTVSIGCRAHRGHSCHRWDAIGVDMTGFRAVCATGVYVGAERRVSARTSMNTFMKCRRTTAIARSKLLLHVVIRVSFARVAQKRKRLLDVTGDTVGPRAQHRGRIRLYRSWQGPKELLGGSMYGILNVDGSPRMAAATYGD